MQSYRQNLTPPIKAADIAIKQGRKGKRPIVVNNEQFITWARLRLQGCTESDCAIMLGCTVKQFQRFIKQEPYRTIWEKGPVETKLALLTRQLAISQMSHPDREVKRTDDQGNVTTVIIPGGPHPASTEMVKWLGKQYLGQSDHVNEHRLPANPEGSVPVLREIRRVEYHVYKSQRGDDEDEDAEDRRDGGRAVVIEHEPVKPPER